MEKINVGVYGGTGYTGGELCRLLLNHTHIAEILPTSRERESFERVHPNLRGSGLRFINPESLEERARELDAIFLCLPSGESMKIAPNFLEAGVNVIDLGADFRLNAETFEKVYGKKHACPELLKEAVYGVSEINREDIKKARLIANPGCYVINGLLGLYPLLKENLIQLEHIPINAINGTTGADSKPRKDTMHTNVFGNILSYNMEGHRHSSEFEEKIKIITGQENVVNFNSSHGDFTTGIHSVASPFIRIEYKKEMNREELLRLYKRYYENEKFIRVIELEKSVSGTEKVYDIYAQVKNIRGTNFCDIGLDYDKERGIVKVISTADNLVRGSAGSAVQNMNLMFGFDETDGLMLYAAP